MTSRKALHALVLEAFPRRRAGCYQGAGYVGPLAAPVATDADVYRAQCIATAEQHRAHAKRLRELPGGIRQWPTLPTDEWGKNEHGANVPLRRDCTQDEVDAEAERMDALAVELEALAEEGT